MLALGVPSRGELGLTGDWGGVRNDLSAKGVDLHAYYIGEVIGNASGGLKRGAVYEGLLEVGVHIDFEKLEWWEGGSFYVSSLFPHGRGPTEHLVGDLLAVSNIEAWESIRLYELWYEHSFLHDRMSLRLGQLLADSEFAYTGPGSLFLNSAFGWPAFISGNTRNGGPAFYVAAPGVRVRVDPADWVFFQAGLYDGDPFDDPEGDPRRSRHGTRFDMDSEQGWLAIFETGLRTPAGEDERGLPGEYKLGGWFHSGEFESNFHDAARQPYVITGAEPHRHGENYGVYVTAEQMVWREREDTSEGLSLFSRIGISPEDRNLFGLVYDGGFTYQGLFPGREEDIAGVGLVYARISDDIRRRERVEFAGSGIPASDYEMVLEISYAFQVGEWLSIQPDFQWVQHPGGSRALPDALVFGLRTTILF